MSPTREDPRAGLVGVLHDLAREISGIARTPRLCGFSARGIPHWLLDLRGGPAS